jgi:hypothetical protein
MLSIMTETTTTSDGNPWFLNPYQDRIGNKWIDAARWPTLLKLGCCPVPFKDLPQDIQSAVRNELAEIKQQQQQRE